MYYIQEIQTNGGVGSSLPTISVKTRDEAMSKFYSVLSSAAISNVEYHACVVFDHQGKLIASDYFNHVQESEVGTDEAF